MTIDTTVKRIDPPTKWEMLAFGSVAFVFVFSVGVFLTIIPVVGWVAGPALMITAIVIAAAHIAGLFRRKTGYAGHCPHCGEAAMAGDPETTGICGACHHKFLHHQSHLEEA